MLKSFCIQCSILAYWCFRLLLAIMPKVKQSYSSKVRNILHEYDSEFTSTPKGELFCKVCDCILKCDKKFMVDSHRGSAKHQRGFLHEKASTQTFLKTPIPDFAEKVTKAFLCADIPLHQLRNSHLSSLFEELGNPLPSEGKCRLKVEKLAKEEALRLKDYLKDQEMFMVVDESDINGKQFLNILVGKLTAPKKTLLFYYKTLSQSVDSIIVTREIDDAVYSLGVARENFCLLLTDTARYMTAAGVLLKKLYSRFFQVTCMGHLLHTCAMKVRANYPAVDELVAMVKAVTIKNRSRRAFFTSISQPPQPVVTRWGSWLTAAFYCSRNLPEVRNIVSSCGELKRL